MTLRGRAWCFGDDIDTDQIYPGKYLPLTDKQEMARHAMEGTDEGAAFLAGVKPGDILVAGRNFGCGSSREHAAVAIRGAGIAAVVARSFARIFYRNCINMALPVLETAAAATVRTGDELELDLATGRIRNLTTGAVLAAAPVSGLEFEIMAAGGLIPFLKARSGGTDD